MAGDFRTLKVWLEARELRNALFGWVESLPGEERLRLADQVIRASRSVTANIAEGHGRFGYQDRLRFLRQARGSLYELIDHVDVAVSCNYLAAAEADEWLQRIESLIQLMNGYGRHLKRKAVSPKLTN